MNKGVLLRDNELAASHVKRATHKATQVNRSDGLLRTQLLFLIRVGRERGWVCVCGWVGKGGGEGGGGRPGGAIFGWAGVLALSGALYSAPDN